MKLLFPLLTLAILAISITPATASATPGDPNILTPADLPATAVQLYSEMGRGHLPVYPTHFGEQQAIDANYARDACQSSATKQLTPWVRTEVDGDPAVPYSRYEFLVEATFACDPPLTQTEVKGNVASDMFAQLPVPIRKFAGLYFKHAEVLCYNTLEEVCEGSVLYNYNDRTICEISNGNQSPVTVLTDTDFGHEHRQTLEGARALESLLPIFRDTRSTYTHPGPNCSPVIQGDLKGLERKAATIDCEATKTGETTCQVHGMIKL